MLILFGKAGKSEKKCIEFYGIIFLKLEYTKHKKMKNHFFSPFFKGELGDKRLV